ncbi:MAG: hypothetical protein OHK0046_34480 [Anaerolineae bacterium]
MPTASEISTMMVERFSADKAGDLNAVIQFDLSGDNGGQFYLNVADGAAEAHEGQAENPRMTLKSSTDEFYKILTGETKAMNAFMTGKIKITGDMGLAMKLQPMLG